MSTADPCGLLAAELEGNPQAEAIAQECQRRMHKRDTNMHALALFGGLLIAGGFAAYMMFGEKKRDSKCMNGGKTVSVGGIDTCDCSGTGFAGPTCEEALCNNGKIDPDTQLCVCTYPDCGTANGVPCSTCTDCAGGPKNTDGTCQKCPGRFAPRADEGYGCPANVKQCNDKNCPKAKCTTKDSNATADGAKCNCSKDYFGIWCEDYEPSAQTVCTDKCKKTVQYEGNHYGDVLAYECRNGGCEVSFTGGSGVRCTEDGSPTTPSIPCTYT